MMKSEKLIIDLLKALKDAQSNVLEMGCTCTAEQMERSGHGRDCVGASTATAWDRLIARAERFVRE